MNLLKSIGTFKEWTAAQPAGILLFRTAGILLAIILLIFLTFCAVAPLNTYRSYQEEVRSDSLYVRAFNPAYIHPELSPLVRELYYKEALLELSGQNTIQLVLNLNDSLLSLSIKGVIIHTVRLQKIRMDHLLYKLPIMEYTGLFAHPLEVRTRHATIVKEPVVVRHAPKDPEEALVNAYEPDTLIQKPAFLFLKTDHGINFILEQESNPGLRNKWVRLVFRSGIWFRNRGSAVASFFSARKQVYEPTIIVTLPVNELRAIYRAMPDQAFLVLAYGNEKPVHN